MFLYLLRKYKRHTSLKIFCILFLFLFIVHISPIYADYQRQIFEAEKALPYVLKKEVQEYRVLRTVFVTNHINQKGLFWLGEGKDERCMQGVVLELQDKQGKQFFATGLVELNLIKEKTEPTLIAYPLSANEYEHLEQGLYQGILTVHPSAYATLNCKLR